MGRDSCKNNHTVKPIKSHAVKTGVSMLSGYLIN